ncbi:hypothetical protein BC834DRAFT_974247 [Gloeopeniophorella convolvens]|nr:hypothetical protein BC834DRAFT_974247 [Gloeopeniophorella convolvens]
MATIGATAAFPPQLVVPSENWDDDFVFQQAKDLPRTRKSDSDEPRWSTSTSQERRGDALAARRSQSSLVQLDDQPSISRLQTWAEPGPSTPPKSHISQTENWDDDFEDKADSPVRRPPSRPHRTPSKLPEIPEPENWDDEFDIHKANSPRKDHAWDSSDEEDGVDFADQEEDKTVTAHPRKAAVSGRLASPPPVPAIPLSLAPSAEAFPGSPTMSVFSIPSARDSVTYSSVAHLPLRPGSSSAQAASPSSPPAHKERRRLRKKSRPPDNNVFELLDRRQDVPSLPSPPQPSSPDPVPVELPSTEVPNPTRTPLLSRIGSVKKWGTRKKRASTGPADVIATTQGGQDATPRASTSQTQSPSRASSWFFRSSGGDTPDSAPGSPSGSAALELKHERSFGRLKVFAAAADSPTKRGKSHAVMLGERPRDIGSTPDGSPPSSPRRPRRPKSMQVPAMSLPSFPRHASYGARSISRSTSRTSTEDFTRENGGKGNHAEKGKEKEGQRGFMSGVRRISLVSSKKHRRSKSSATIEDVVESASIPQIPVSAVPMTPSISAQLLPPIELQPPSPPRGPREAQPRRSTTSEQSIASTSETPVAGVESLLLRPSIDAPSIPSPSTITPRPSPTKSPGSPQSASLGRATQPPPPTSVTGIVPRRNSLGDLKIPARISQAQVGLKRDLGMVREFAAGVEKLKDLQSLYQSLASEAQAVLLEEPRPPSRTTSPTFFNLPRPRSRARSNTNPNPIIVTANPHKQFAASFFHLDHKYKISWECAELLIELGGGAPAPSMSPPPSSFSAPAQQSAYPSDSINGRRSRERAITLAGDEAGPPFPMAFSGPPAASMPSEWRASTGRNDLSQRQLWLLRDMLNKPDSSPTMLANLQIPEEGPVNRNWRWGEATSSTITLPSEESARNSSPSKKRRYSRLGMSGLRDMLRSLTRSHHRHPLPIPFRPASSASTSASSSYDDQSQHGHTQRAPKTSTGPEATSSIRASSPFRTAPALTHKSPRRPSIASIFRFAQKSKGSPSTEAESSSGHSPRQPQPHILHSSSSGSDLGSRIDPMDEEEDWDHLDSAEDLDAAARALGLKDANGMATLRGRRSRHPYEPGRERKPAVLRKERPANASQSSLSLWADSPSTSSRSQISLAATAVPASPPLPVPPPAAASPPGPFMRSTRLSNVEEVVEAQGSLAVAPTLSKGKSRSPRRLSSRRGPLTGSVRSVPPPTHTLPAGDMTSLALSLTPETIRPLLENAREVHARCSECIVEMRALLAARPL